jgi:hypothetical protein
MAGLAALVSSVESRRCGSTCSRHAPFKRLNDQVARIIVDVRDSAALETRYSQRLHAVLPHVGWRGPLDLIPSITPVCPRSELPKKARAPGIAAWFEKMTDAIDTEMNEPLTGAAYSLNSSSFGHGWGYCCCSWIGRCICGDWRGVNCQAIQVDHGMLCTCKCDGRAHCRAGIFQL